MTRRDADHDRLDRGRRSSRRRSSTIPGRAIINSINMENGRKRIDTRRAAREEARRGARRADDRPDRHGEDARAEARGRAEDLRHRRRRVRARRRRTSSTTTSPSRSRRATRSGSTRRVETIEGIRLIKRELPGVFTSLGVSQRELRPRAGSARGAQLRVPAPLRRGGARHGDRESGARAAVRRDSAPRSARSPTTWCSTAAPTRCSASSSTSRRAEARTARGGRERRIRRPA